MFPKELAQVVSYWWYLVTGVSERRGTEGFMLRANLRRAGRGDPGVTWNAEKHLSVQNQKLVLCWA